MALLWLRVIRRPEYGSVYGKGLEKSAEFDEIQRPECGSAYDEMRTRKLGFARNTISGFGGSPQTG
jgi:hypothetical protein